MIGKKEALKMGLGLILHAKYWLLFTLDDYAIAISPMREQYKPKFKLSRYFHFFAGIMSYIALN